MFKIAILIFLILIIGCSEKVWITVKEGKMVVNTTPPNGVWVNDTLVCDETELSNIDYREYLDWTERVYGSNSDKFQKALLDSTIIYTFFEQLNSERDSIFKKYFEERINYFKHPSYDDYPVIGITYEQALGYSEWRSDRVYEMMLIEKKLISIHPKVDSASHFTIERYIKGQYFNYFSSKKVPIPRFRLPTIEEWELVAKKNNGDEWGINSNRKEVIKYQKEGLDFFLTKDYIINRLDLIKRENSNAFKSIPYVIPVRAFFHYKNDIYNLIGNVAEMTNTEGVAKGGSWYQTNEQSKIENNISYNKHQVWLGVRNVCTWEIPK